MGRCVQANRAAERLLSTEDVVTLEHGQLLFADRDVRAQVTTSALASTAKDGLLALRRPSCDLAVIDLFRRYGAQYRFDYLMIVAQAFQESQLDQSRHGASGAVGLMQIRPSAAASKPIGIAWVDRDPDRNVHAGCAYLRYLADTYVPDPAIDPTNRTLMSLAAYNAGPDNLRKFRDVALRTGLDPNVWFNNVEIGAAKVSGFTPVQYVRNIYKYYVSYKLSAERLEASRKAREATEQTR